MDPAATAATRSAGQRVACRPSEKGRAASSSTRSGRKTRSRCSAAWGPSVFVLDSDFVRLLLVAFITAPLGMGTATATTLPRTYIYVHGHTVGYVEGSDFWYASWGSDIGAWVEKASGTRFFSGCESERDAHRYGTAHRVAWNAWTVSTFPGFRPVGSVQLEAPRRWAMFNVRGRSIGETRGPNGVVAGLAWLTINWCR
jgi:hypothetical protein